MARPPSKRCNASRGRRRSATFLALASQQRVHDAALRSHVKDVVFNHPLQPIFFRDVPEPSASRVLDVPTVAVQLLSRALLLPHSDARMLRLGAALQALRGAHSKERREKSAPDPAPNASAAAEVWYQRGLAEPRASSRRRRCFARAGSLGHLSAQLEAGRAFLTAGLHAEALDWLAAAAPQRGGGSDGSWYGGEAEAAALLADMRAGGLGCAEDAAEAARLYALAVDCSDWEMRDERQQLSTHGQSRPLRKLAVAERLRVSYVLGMLLVRGSGTAAFPPDPHSAAKRLRALLDLPAEEIRTEADAAAAAQLRPGAAFYLAMALMAQVRMEATAPQRERWEEIEGLLKEAADGGQAQAGAVLASIVGAGSV